MSTEAHSRSPFPTLRRHNTAGVLCNGPTALPLLFGLPVSEPTVSGRLIRPNIRRKAVMRTQSETATE